MGWGRCGINDHGQAMGYSVKATCDEDGCSAVIDRGLAHVCGDMHEDPETCHKYYCSDHLIGRRCVRCNSESAE